MLEIILPAWLIGILLSFITAPLGAFVVWRKMAYFGDTLAHSALLGVALGIFIEINPYLAILILTLCITLLMVWLENHTQYSVEGVNIQRMRFSLMILTALTIALSMKFVGALIITSLLIIPAATARRFARTPETMAMIAVVISMLAITMGLELSAFYNTAAGPSVVICSALLFALSFLWKEQG
ncbi:metal ABC transporter permease [Glaesserella parasuis]|nr:metal ABC transporter permease [Glaesserella parasuis]MCU1107398.1 metal ABC transporter permease [Glaesserella parasuis]MDE3975553.1 metal ABC transporter permease [Glaesserella parasuis]